MGKIILTYEWTPGGKIEVKSEVNDEDEVIVLEVECDGWFDKTAAEICAVLRSYHESKVLDRMCDEMKEGA